MNFMSFQSRNKNKPRRGFSLLEMVVAAALVTGTLVPALAVIRDSMAKSRELHRRHLLSNYAVEILETAVADAAMEAVWNYDPAVSDEQAVAGATGLRYILIKADAAAYGGLDDRLMHISVTVYDDADGDSTLDTEELQETYRTKVANLNSYKNINDE